MPPILSIIITICIIAIAIRIALKVTGCLVKIIIFGIALWVATMVLNLSFDFMTDIFNIFI